MFIALAVLAVVYFTGLFLLIRAWRSQPKWIDREHGQPHSHS